MESNYIFVDVDGPIVTVYDHDGEIDSKTFVADSSYREERSDVVTDDPKRDACKYAEREAKRLGIDWGSNE